MKQSRREYLHILLRASLRFLPSLKVAFSHSLKLPQMILRHTVSQRTSIKTVAGPIKTYQIDPLSKRNLLICLQIRIDVHIHLCQCHQMCSLHIVPLLTAAHQRGAVHMGLHLSYPRMKGKCTQFGRIQNFYAGWTPSCHC